MRRAPWAERCAGAILLLALLPLTPQAAAECTCLWEGSFADVHGSADLVLAAEVISRKGNSVDMRVEELLRGDPYRDTVRVWMQTRDYCRPDADDFPEASRWVLALRRIDEVPADGFSPSTPNQSYGRKGDYILSSCGGYWLALEGEAVTGNLVNGPRWAREVEMTPVRLSLLRAFIAGDATAEALAEATKEDPELMELLLDTKSFLRGQEPVDPQEDFDPGPTDQPRAEEGAAQS